MKLNPKCMACQLRKQEANIRHFDDEDRKKQYMEKIHQREFKFHCDSINILTNSSAGSWNCI